MTEIRFYHLQQDTTSRAVPEILAKAVSRDMRVLLKVPDEERAKHYDDWLWRFQPDSFLPHGTGNDAHGDKQPIWISTSDQAPNNPSMAFVVEMADLPPFAGFELICVMFDSENQDRLEKARGLWSQLKQQEGLTLTYWKQQDNGAWVKQDI